MHAELDTGTYPTGVKISDGQMDALPLTRHDWHGDWNYTLRPEAYDQRQPRPRPVRPAQPRPGLAVPPGPDRADRPAVGRPDHRAGRCPTRPSGKPPLQAPRRPARPQAPGRHPPALTLADQVLATVLRLRFRLPQPDLAELFGVVTGTIAKAERQARPLLEQHGHQIEPAPAPIKTLAELTAYASAHGVELTPKTKPAC